MINMDAAASLTLLLLLSFHISHLEHQIPGIYGGRYHQPNYYQNYPIQITCITVKNSYCQEDYNCKANGIGNQEPS